jgi:hypothetical protein
MRLQLALNLCRFTIPVGTSDQSRPIKDINDIRLRCPEHLKDTVFYFR